jgi:nitrate reductase NapAB chaperone NapD
MTVQSYLVYPQAGLVQAVARSLAEMPACEVLKSDNRDLLIVITESDSAEAQKALETQLEGVPGIECLALVSGWME